MKILLLAPQPFYQERGTPIAVKLLCEVLSKRENTKITLLTYHEGQDVNIDNVELKRIKANWIKNVPPGISVKKLLCDIIFFFTFLKLILLSRKEQYDIIHAVEESVFMAVITKLLFRIPYVYDMDSSLSLQVSEKWRWTKPIANILKTFELVAIKLSIAVVPVCFSLYEIASKAGAKNNQMLRDISLLDINIVPPSNVLILRDALKLPSNSQIGLYVGNLEKYQGVDLLIESFSLIKESLKNSHIIIIGGTSEHINYYKEKTLQLGLAEQVHLLGPQPVSHLKQLALQATILVSPRILGNNTPMKVYSYLHSGIPVVATNLPTHTQVLNDQIAILGNANPEDFGKALLTAFQDQELRESIGKMALKEAEEKYSFGVFQRDLNRLYDQLEQEAIKTQLV